MCYYWIYRHQTNPVLTLRTGLDMASLNLLFIALLIFLVSGQDLFEDDRSSNSTDPIREPKRGRPGSPYVKCGRWTNRVVNIGYIGYGTFEADKNVKKCVANFQMTSCLEMELVCDKFMVDNRDDFRCLKGDVFMVKADDTQPRRFCKRATLTPAYPARAQRSLKIWYRGSSGILGKGTYPNAGVKCTIRCHKAF